MVKIFLNILEFLLSIILSKKLNIKIINKEEEISLTIKGSGEKSILSKSLNSSNSPYQVIINEDLVNISRNNKYILPFEENNITIKWNYQLTDISNMFFCLTDITKIDF